MEQKKSDIPILILKNDLPKELVSSIPAPFVPMHFRTTLEAIDELNKRDFPVIIMALGILPDYSDHFLPLLKAAKASKPQTFAIIWSQTASEDAKTRESCFEQGANMVGICIASVKAALSQIAFQLNSGGKLTCPICGFQKLSEDALWSHLPLFHINEPNYSKNCVLCGKKSSPNIQVHFRNAHGPAGRGEVKRDERDEIMLYAFALVVVQRKKDKRFLVVQEFANSGFWLPGGGVDQGEGLMEAAIRETKEEAGISIKLTGVLTFQYKSRDYVRLRVIFYAEPVDENEKPKSLPDYESAGATYISYEDLKHVRLRGSEPEIWFKYVTQGGQIYPLSIFSKE